MSRSYRELPSGLSEKILKAEQRKRQSLIEHARQESEVLRMIEHERCEEHARAKSMFFLWFILDKCLHRLEQQRDTHAPVFPDDPWDGLFRESVERIPELKRLCKDIWFAYINIDKPKFAEWP